MDHSRDYQYEPDYAVPPGETLQETLTALGLTQAGLAERTGLTRKTINLIIKGKAPLTTETALLFERVLGVPSGFWNSRERLYRETLARLAEERKLGQETDWVRHFPVKEMVKQGWIPASNDRVSIMRLLLSFFGVASFRQWQSIWMDPDAIFRSSPAFEKDPYALAAWLRMGEVIARGKSTKAYEAAHFTNAVDNARGLTRAPLEEAMPRLVEMCAEAGVAVAIVPQLPRIRTSGATRWLSPNKAIIQLSMRYKTDDQLWFTFFHEAAHILLHGKREVFLEDESGCGPEQKEREADRFASDKLVPPRAFASFVRGRRHFSKDDIRQFAEKIGVSPGIVVGRLQHDKLMPYNCCNDLKRKLDWPREEDARKREI